VTKLPAVTALLLNYREERRTVSCITSLLEQAVENILIWDNSADGGASIAAVMEYFADDPRVRMHISDRNLGFAAGVNTGLILCRELFPNTWVLLINNDARLLPGGCRKLKDALICSPNAKVSFPDINHAGVVLGRTYYQIWSGKLSRTPCIGGFSYASGCCLLIALDRISLPLFDEDFFMYGEDSELGWRWRKQPNNMVHVSETLVEHEGSASSGLGSPFYEERMITAHLILVRKIAGANTIKRYFLYSVRSLMLLVRAIVRCYRFRSLVPWVALSRGYKNVFHTDPLLQPSTSAITYDQHSKVN
jgi:N-acetylglucosaminyl-diphospho-decaprenol L-rhamnosyltransferase